MTLKKQITVAVVGGSGLIGVRHCQHVVDCNDTHLVAIVDPNPEASGIASRHAVAWYATLAQLLDSVEKPDAAIVCTPNHTHVAISIQLMQAGIHVLCEKPVSHDTESAQRLIKEAAISQATLLIGHHRRFNPYVIEMQKIVTSGSLGQIVAVSGLWTAAKPHEYFSGQNSWRQDRARGGGVVAINLIHDIDLLLYLFGPVRRIHAEQTMSTRTAMKDTVEEGAAVTIRFDSGVVGTFIVADNVASPHSFEMGTGENPNIPHTGFDCYRIFGTRGTLSFPDMVLTSYHDTPTWNKAPEKQIVKVDNVDVAPLASQLQHFVKVCRGEMVPSCSGQDGLDALKVCEAVRTAVSKPERGGTVIL